MLEELISSGRIVDYMLGFVVLEVLALLTIRRLRGTGIATLPLLTNIGAGCSLMLALRADLTGSGWGIVAVFLVLSLVFHISDLSLRWREAQKAAGAA